MQCIAVQAVRALAARTPVSVEGSTVRCKEGGCAVQYKVQLNAAQRREAEAVRCGGVRCSAVQCGAEHSGAVRCGAVQHDAMEFAKQCAE